MLTIFTAREREVTSIPIEAVLRDGEIDIIPEVQGHEYFDITYRRDRLTVKAGKYIGLIPLNDRVFIQVEPKVPIANLLAMLSAGEGEITELPFLTREYGTTAGAPPTQLLAAIASTFASALCAIEVNGLRKRYDPLTEGGDFLKGQIRFNESVQRYWSHGTRHAAVSTFFDLTADITENRLLRYACHILLVHHLRAEVLGDTIRLLSHFEEVFSRAGVRLQPSGAQDILRSAEHSPEYLRALRLARLIVSGQGIELRGDGEDVSLPSFLIDMETLFEDYVRHVIATRLTGVEVLNGNTEGSKHLFDDRKSPPVTPDIVVRRDTEYPLIGEVKYKSLENRDDRYQVLAYGLSYRARDIVLILPTDGVDSSGLVDVGEVNGIRVHRYRFDLAAGDLDAEEGRIAASLQGLLRARACSQSGSGLLSVP